MPVVARVPPQMKKTVTEDAAFFQYSYWKESARFFIMVTVSDRWG